MLRPPGGVSCCFLVVGEYTRLPAKPSQEREIAGLPELSFAALIQLDFRRRVLVSVDDVRVTGVDVPCSRYLWVYAAASHLSASAALML
jgi:hypothetical protein